MDFLFDIFFGALLGLCKLIMPNYKFKKWQEILLILLSVILLISSIGCLIAGIHLLSTNYDNRTLSAALTTAGGLLLFIQCIVFFVLIGYGLKAETHKKDDTNENE